LTRIIHKKEAGTGKTFRPAFYFAYSRKAEIFRACASLGLSVLIFYLKSKLPEYEHKANTGHYKERVSNN
jgi:hypothetical protein